ncbi:hypothetical protein B0T17DRAFT_494506 [Bombardia bombarda]|uniref:Uncharacterized protein n=1 Tax=Bombardia bombarda TaxID=252184 RepID=A0AA39WUW8_9PEZI|nr:hypothetical protein B0T17DRAFT_494506 [Bombardia bombarda]
MSRTQCPSTCLSDKPHDGFVSDVTTHFNGCLPVSRRTAFFNHLPTESQQRILRNNERVAELRARFERIHFHSAPGLRLRNFKSAMSRWHNATNRVAGLTPAGPKMHAAEASMSGMGTYTTHQDVNDLIKAPVVYFKDGHPLNVPGLPNNFPNQKITMSHLMSEDSARNPLLHPCEDNVVRYFHLPANNMSWVEEVMARYYHEKRPEPDNLFLKSKLRRSRTCTEMLLRPEYWQGQQSSDTDDFQVHARHMRPFCDGISIDSVSAEQDPKNLALFMPYLHWETDRGRVNSATIAKDVVKQNMSSISDVVDQAQHQLHVSHVETQDTGPTLLDTDPSRSGSIHVTSRKRALGDVLIAAAALLEAMDAHVEEQLMVKYLHAQPPLHPRRTLDQSYYGALKNTGTRDRDQVVFRGTTPEPHDCAGPDTCSQCNEDIRKVPRIVMVDQLWLWILDENTVITAFPRRLSRHRPDPSAIHKSLRMRFQQLRRGEVSSAYDLALLIVDECSRVFFDRTKTNDRQPNLVELFTSAIRDLTYKQTAAFDQFLIYTHLASRDYKRERYIASDRSTQNTLLNINPEGKLLKEVKDIIDEIHIMMRIKEQQQAVIDSLVKLVKKRLVPIARQAMAKQSLSYEFEERERHSFKELGEKESQVAERTLTRADQLLLDLKERVAELRTLLQNAQQTSIALKDLLTLKQQQASVIEAREAVTQAQLTLKQGQSIMIFTIVTIIFLPLSFCVGLFGMNAAEFNDGLLPLSTEFRFMFPISTGIILVSFLFAFSQSVLNNSVVMLARSTFGFCWNVVWTWMMVKSGMYMKGRDMQRKASRLRDKEGKIVGGWKAEVLRKGRNLEKMKVAGHVRELAMVRSSTRMDHLDGQGMGLGAASGRGTPFSPYSVSGGMPGSPFFASPAAPQDIQQRIGLAVTELDRDSVDVEMGDGVSMKKLGSRRRLV